MSDILIDNQTPATAPSAGQVVIYPDSVTKLLTVKNDTGRAFSLGGGIRNCNTADVTANALNTYLTGSSLSVPPHLLQASAIFRWNFTMTKTGAGTAAPVWTIVVGTLGTTGDTVRVTFTSPSLQTANTDIGVVEISAVLRNTGAAGVLAGGLSLTHANAATGFASVANVVVQANSAGFDTTAASLIVGVCVNPGALGVWTHQVVVAEMMNM